MNSIEQRYLTAIRRRVCHYCRDLMADGVCGLADRVCPIERSLHEIVQMVHYVHDQPIGPYLDDLRRMVCSACERQDLAGRCVLRLKGGCALDRYFVRVIEAVDDVHEELRAEARSVPGGG